MHLNELNDEERESFDRAMDTVRSMRHEEQLAIIEHAVATSIRYANIGKDQILTDWARGLLTTLRLNASKAFREASQHAPDLSLPGVSAKELLAGLRR